MDFTEPATSPFPSILLFGLLALGLVVLTVYAVVFVGRRNAYIERMVKIENNDRQMEYDWRPRKRRRRRDPRPAPYTRHDWLAAQRAEKLFNRAYGFADFISGLIIPAAFVAVVSVGVLSAFYLLTQHPSVTAKQLLIPAVEEEYGIELTEAQVGDLARLGAVRVGLVETPDTDFQVYGSTVLRTDGEMVEAHLAWVDDEYVLLAGDPLTLTELGS